MGPTILTIPSTLRRIYAEAGRRVEEHLELIRLDPQWRCFYDDGSILDLREDVGEMASELAKFSTRAGVAAGYRRFLERSARLNAIAERHFFCARSARSARCSAPTAIRPALRALVDMRPGMSVASMVRSMVPDVRVTQMLDHFTQYVGSPPDQSPAVLCGIAHMQTDEGCGTPREVSARCPGRLEELMRELGVESRCGVGVRRILCDPGGRVRGLLTDDGEEIPVAAVVANSDIVRTHRDLIDGTPLHRFEARRRYEPACSGVVLDLGLDRAMGTSRTTTSSSRTIPKRNSTRSTARANPRRPDVLRRGAGPDRARRGTPGRRGSLRSGPHSLSAAPPQLDSASALLPPHHPRQAGLHGRPPRPGTAHRFERRLTPQDIHDRFGVLDGAIYGLASHGKLLGAFKPSNRSPDVKGLYFAGGSRTLARACRWS